ncbi:MAG: AMP-binding protein [Alphaproteobacteria bacterium]|nr:AMP-binding protein [Alphaproteobacteria bacterium]
MANGEFYDDLESRDPEEREQALFKALPEQIAHAKVNAPYFAALLTDINPDEIASRDALAQLPVTRKSDLIELQTKSRPLGGLNAVPPGKMRRIYQSPGPIYDVDGFGDDWWGTARALYAAGIRAGDVVHNTFAYHFTPAGLMMETGTAAIGCAVVPAGVGNTELQVQAIADIGCDAYTGTPSFLKIILEKADELDRDISSLTKALVGAEPLPPALRQDIEDRGVNCQQIYASADLGNLGYESPAREGLIVDEGVFVEIVRPGTNDLVNDGEVGEIVATCFRHEYPLIRFGTGDLSRIIPGASPCGRTNTRLQGWMGRADQTTKVKGMFVHPVQIAKIVARHPEVLKARLVVDSRDTTDVMTLSCEVDDPNVAADGAKRLDEEITATIQSVCKLRGEVCFVAPGSLPNDGKVIDDIRDHSA